MTPSMCIWTPPCHVVRKLSAEQKLNTRILCETGPNTLKAYKQQWSHNDL